MSQIQSQMKEAKRVIEELEMAKSTAEATAIKQRDDGEVEKAMAIAEVKQQMHITMDTKDTEMQAMHGNLKTLKAENDAMTEKIATLEHDGGSWSYIVNHALYFTLCRRNLCRQ